MSSEKNSLTLAGYLKNNAGAAACQLIAIALAGLMMLAFGLAAEQAAAVCLLLVCALAVATTIKYAAKRRFYADLAQTVDALAEKGCGWLAPELMDAPRGLEERLVLENLRVASKSMADQVAALRAEQREYRDYVETWVHEVKTPIAAARLAAANDLTPTTEAIDVELRRVEGFVDQSLFYARSSSVDRDFQLRRVELGECVRAALRSASRTLIDAGVSPQLGELDVEVHADPKWLEFVIRQVLVNAAKYRRSDAALAGEPARVRITAEKVATGLDAWCVTLRIEDNGIGIPASDLSRVFDRGFTGANGRAYPRSTGIGLYLVRTLCEKMGLRARVFSTPGEGTCVAIEFPDSYAG